MIDDILISRPIMWPDPLQNQLPILIKNNVALAQVPLTPPPAPQIETPLAGTATGFQFSFNQVEVPTGATNVISSYRIYRNTLNVFNRNLEATIPHDPTHQGAVTFTDTITAATGQNYYYWVTAVDSTGQESDPNAAQCSSAVPGSIGSTPYSNTGSFSYASDTSSITWSWDLNTNPFYRADDTTTSGGTGSQAITGLASNTTYLFFPYWDETTQAIGWVDGGSGTPSYAFAASTQAILAKQNLRNRIPLSIGGMSGHTTASGSGGGTGGGGGGGGGGKILPP